jgi:hypothetical protein
MLPDRPSCPFQSTHQPQLLTSKHTHPAAAGTTQPGPALAPVSPSSGEAEFNLFFHDHSSQASSRDADPPQLES